MSLKPPLPPNVILDYRHVYDEGTQQSTEDGINFTGAGVTVTEDTANHRLNVSIPGGAVGTGDEPYTVVDGLTADPRAVTDWGALLNTALAGGARHFLFGAFDYPFTTTINCNGRGGVVFQGSAGQAWGDPGASSGKTRLVWGGTGAGLAVDFRNILNGPVVEDIIWVYSSNLYTGSYMSFFNSAIATFRRCSFFSVGSAIATAACAVSLDKIVGAVFEECTFGGGVASDFLSPIRGQESGGGGYSNEVRFHECIWQGGANAGVTNPGLGWIFDHCVFEFFNLGASKPYITTDFNYVTDFPQLILNDCAWWDAGAGTQKAVLFPAGNYADFTAINCKDHNTETTLSKLYDFQGTGSIVIEGGNTNNAIDVGDGGVAGSRKDYVRIVGIKCQGATKTTILKNTTTAHTNVEIAVNHGPASREGNSGQSRSVSHETSIRIDQPAMVASSGVVNHDFTILGSDLAGVIMIHNSGGGVGSTGLLGDVTLAAAPATPPAMTGSGVSTHTQFPLVEVWPFQADDAGSFFSTANMATTYACQPYAYAKTIGNSGSQASFSIGVNVGIPAGGRIGIGYRVIHL